MRRSPGRGRDTTGDSAVGDVAGDSLLAEVSSRIEDERDRVLTLAHIGLDLSPRNLARVVGTTAAEVTDRVDATIARLREDTEFVAMLGDLNHAGRNDRYQALILHLGLEDWFCSYCGEFIRQAERGPKRKTCKDECRYRFWKADGRGWKDQHQPLSAEDHTSASNLNRQYMQDSDAYEEKLRALLRPIDAGQQRFTDSLWGQADTKCRDRALLLLGFLCPAPVTSSDLANIRITDISRRPVGMEVQLNQRTSRRVNARYIIVPASTDSQICPVTAVLACQTRLTSTGRSDGPLFIQMDPRGNLPNHQREDNGLTSEGVVQVITNAYRCASPLKMEVGLNRHTPLRDFLDEITISA